MTDENIDPLLDAQAAAIAQQAQIAMDSLMVLIASGINPVEAVKRVQGTFNGAFKAQLQQAFEQVLQSPVSAAQIAALPVTGLPLSANLYRQVQQTSMEVGALVRQHNAGLHDARALAIRLYDGYNPKGGIQRPIEQRSLATLPKPLRELMRADVTLKGSYEALLAEVQTAASRLKTGALKAAYTEVIDKWIAGKGRESLQRKLDVAFREKTRYHANRIAQTELARAHQDKVGSEFMQDDTITVVQVVMAPGHPVTDICDMHSRANLFNLGPGCYPKARAPKPTFHPHCLTGDALITSAGVINSVSKRWFDGDAVVITTASGKSLTATINHPILTPSGWVGAGFIDIGSDVVCRVIPIGVTGDSIGNDNHQNMPASIAEIVDSFLCSGEVTTAEVPEASEHFHGDGMAGQIAVIGANRKLLDGPNSDAGKLAADGSFVLPNVTQIVLPGESSLELEIECPFYSSDGFVSVADLQLPLIGGHPAPLDQLLLTGGSFDNPRTFEPEVNDIATDSKLASQIIDGATGPVFIDKVVNIEVVHISCHVYNLETSEHHYTSNGIINHNCRCILRSRPDLSAINAREVPDGEAAYLRSLPAADAARIVGSKDRLQRVLGGTSLDDVSNTGINPEYHLKRLGQLDLSVVHPARVPLTLEVAAGL